MYQLFKTEGKDEFVFIERCVPLEQPTPLTPY